MSQTIAHSSTPVLLRRALLGNAIFSTITGGLFVVGASPLSALIGLPSPAILIVMGLGVIGYAAFLFRAIRLDSIPRSLAVTTLVADSVWVVASVALLVTDWVPFTPEGKWLVAIIADLVGLFALLEFIGLRQMR
ncbi:MAG TPA: hypothetical protein VI547_01335 [Anaerolineales bacterium]|nr:hypothetical protein [Anaerolineales bacterium]